MQTLSIVPDTVAALPVDQHTLFRLTAPAMPDSFFAEWLENHKEEYLGPHPLDGLKPQLREQVEELRYDGCLENEEAIPMPQLATLHRLVDAAILYDKREDAWMSKLQTWVQANIHWQHWYANQAVGLKDPEPLTLC